MAMAVDDHGTAASSAAGGGDGSPQGRRRSPWSQVVRGESSADTVAAASRSPSSSPRLAATDSIPPDPPETENSAWELQPEVSDDGSGNSNGNAARSMKPAWNKPLNGVIEGTSVMGGSVSWPALSESTRSTGKSSSDSLKALSDGSASSSQGPIISRTPQKQANTNANANSVANHGMTRQRSIKHSGSGSAQGGGFNSPPPPPIPPPMPPPFPTFMEFSTYGNYGNPVIDSSWRGARPLTGVGSQAGNDHYTRSQRNSSRRNNFGGRPRGDGQYHNNHGGRRDHDRRDVHLRHQFVPPGPGGYMPPPPPPLVSASFIAHPPMQSFVGGPLGFDVAPSYMYVQTLSRFITPSAPPDPVFFPVADPALGVSIVKQIDYYFSDANLVKDDYLRSNMDEEGWVPINLIASFPRVKCWTNEIPVILEFLRSSMVVEVKGDKIRRRNDWKKWIHSGSSHVSSDSTFQTPVRSSDDILTNSIKKISLNEVTRSKKGVPNLIDSEKETSQSRLSEDSARTSIVANGDVPAAKFCLS